MTPSDEEIDKMVAWLKDDAPHSGHGSMRAADMLLALRVRAEAAEKALTALVSWKDYKDTHGKDAAYEAGKDEAWATARAALEAKP